jgi:hypothetical protein
MTMWHNLMHRLMMSRGYVVTAIDAKGTVWIGYKCVKCGRVSGIHASWNGCPPGKDFR